MWRGKLHCGDRSESTLYPRLPDFHKIVAFRRLPGFAHLSVSLEQHWDEYGPLVELHWWGENQTTWRKPCPSANLCTTNLTLTDMGAISVKRDRNWTVSVTCTAWSTACDTYRTENTSNVQPQHSIVTNATIFTGHKLMQNNTVTTSTKKSHCWQADTPSNNQ
jgi:hypothetical protein